MVEWGGSLLLGGDARGGWRQYGKNTAYVAPTRQFGEFPELVRDPAAVPREVGAAAALVLRAHLTVVLGLL